MLYETGNARVCRNVVLAMEKARNNVNMREVNIVKGINRTYETKSKLHFSDLRIFSTDR
jgi:hypothetical protein